MNKEQIIQVANEFAERECEIGEVDHDALQKLSKGFYWGAIWRINSVWHNKDELPELYAYVLIESVTGYFKITVAYRNIRLNNCKRWAYIKDLVPGIEEDNQ